MKQSFFKHGLILLTLTVAVLSGCSSSTKQSSGDMTCYASASVVSGNTATANTSVVLNNLSVQVLNGQGGPYSMVVPTVGTVSSASIAYTYANNFTVTTGASGGVTSQVSVTDTATSKTAACVISAGSGGSGTNTFSNGTFTVTASPSATATVGSTITLSVSAPSVTSPVYSFVQTSTVSGVTVTGSGTTATVTSTVATTANVTVTMVSNASGAAVSRLNVTLYFTGSSSGTNTFTNGSYTVTVSPSATATVGATVTLSVASSTIVNPVYSFSQSYSQTGVSVSGSGTSGYVYSSVATTVYVNVTLVSNSSGVGTLTLSVPIVFTGSGSSGYSLAVTASPTGVVAVGSTVTVSAVASGISDPIYALSLVSAPASGVTYYTGGTGVFYVSSQYAASLVLNVTATSASNASIYKTSPVTIQFGSGSSSALTCYASYWPQYPYVGQTVIFYVTAATGEPLKVTSFDPGEAWTSGGPVYPLYPPLGVYYSYAGLKNVRIFAQSVSTGTVCNGGAALAGSVTIY